MEALGDGRLDGSGASTVARDVLDGGGWRGIAGVRGVLLRR